jgi:hypothetical protein
MISIILLKHYQAYKLLELTVSDLIKMSYTVDDPGICQQTDL